MDFQFFNNFFMKDNPNRNKLIKFISFEQFSLSRNFPHFPRAMTKKINLVKSCPMIEKIKFLILRFLKGWQFLVILYMWCESNSLVSISFSFDRIMHEELSPPQIYINAGDISAGPRGTKP